MACGSFLAGRSDIFLSTFCMQKQKKNETKLLITTSAYEFRSSQQNHRPNNEKSIPFQSAVIERIAFVERTKNTQKKRPTVPSKLLTVYVPHFYLRRMCVRVCQHVDINIILHISISFCARPSHALPTKNRFVNTEKNCLFFFSVAGNLKL